MSERKAKPAGMHHERDEFAAAIAFTERETGFLGRLIEKDYYCSVILAYLFGHEPPTSFIFKGGTSLNKVHFGFYRLSEDLDFTISVAPDATRGDRRKARAPFESRLSGLTRAHPEIDFSKPWVGANESMQYAAEVSYASVITTAPETIKIEVGLREPLILESEVGAAKTLLINALSGQSVIPSFSLRYMARREAMAEKSRAALARLTPAIRDVFDLWHAKREGGLPIEDKAFTELVQTKLAVPGTGPASASNERRDEFRAQVETDLRPVLRPADFERFNFDEAWQLVEELARAVLPK